MAKRPRKKTGKVPIRITINNLVPDDTNAMCNHGDKIQFTAQGQACVVVFKEFPLMGLSLGIGQSVVVVVCDTDFAIHYGVAAGTLKNTKIANAPYRIQSGGGLEWRRKKK
jgi:hypothetical protein